MRCGASRAEHNTIFQEPGLDVLSACADKLTSCEPIVGGNLPENEGSQLYQQLDMLLQIRREVRRELLRESRKHPAQELLRQIPRLGPIRVALVIALLQTPHRVRTKRQLWAYCGLALQTRSSGEYRFTGGQLQHSQKLPALRGLNINARNLIRLTQAAVSGFVRSNLAKVVKGS